MEPGGVASHAGPVQSRQASRWTADGRLATSDRQRPECPPRRTHGSAAESAHAPVPTFGLLPPVAATEVHRPRCLERTCWGCAGGATDAACSRRLMRMPATSAHTARHTNTEPVTALPASPKTTPAVSATSLNGPPVKAKEKYLTQGPEAGQAPTKRVLPELGVALTSRARRVRASAVLATAHR
jgi:hypothetical protein